MTFRQRITLITALLIFLASALWRCSSGGLFSRKDEGQIIYDVSFPFEANSLLLELYPKEMVFEFKKDLIHTSVKSSYGVISTEFIIDNDEMTFTQMLKSFNERTYMELTEEAMPIWLKQYPRVRIEETDRTDSIAGYLCHHAIAYFLNDSVPPIDLYYTRDLSVRGTNWWNQFSALDGFLLGYEVEQYGKRMRLRAREVRFEPVSDERFVVPADYVKVDPGGMRHRIKSLMEEFMN